MIYNTRATGAGILRLGMLAHAELENIPIYSEYVPDNVELPYIVINHYVGGEDNDAYYARAADMMYKVYAHSFDMLEAQTLEGYIQDALHYKIPDISALNNALEDYQVSVYGNILLHYPDFWVDVVQLRPVYRAGGIYRVRFSVMGDN